MLLIYSIILVYITLSIYPSLSDIFPLRRNYYESWSSPSICMEVFHFYPNTPKYLYGTFQYSRYSGLNYTKTKENSAKYFFIRVERPCETSVVFTTFGDDFKVIKIKMTLSLDSKKRDFSSFDYEFYNGFEPKTYALQDNQQIFGTRVKVFHDAKNYIGVSVNSKGMYKFDEKSTAPQNNALCIISENNLAAVLKTDNEIVRSSDFIVGLTIWKFRDNETRGYREYNSYACYKDDIYPDVQIIFITEEENLRIEFKLKLSKYSFKSRLNLENMEKQNKKIDLPYALYDDVHNLKKIPQEYSKIFLTFLNFKSTICKDGSYVVIYHSDDDTVCYITAKKKIKILSYVEGIIKIDRSSEDPCGETKNKE